jgi:hypothetical protein
MCIVADHDLTESAVTNHVEFERSIVILRTSTLTIGAHSPTKPLPLVCC